MIWDSPPEEPCIGDINNYESLGVFKSETKYIDIEGLTEIQIIPEWWKIAWKDKPYNLDYVVATIWPEKGKTVDDYRRDVIQLNNVKATKVEKKYSSIKGKYYLVVLFNKQAAINSLGEVRVGEWYNVVVSGMTKNNEYFGGGQQIKIIE
jgi:hypothetical protein